MTAPVAAAIRVVTTTVSNSRGVNDMTRRLAAGAAIFLFVAACSAAASAQGLVDPFGRDTVTISRDDLALMNQAIEKVLEANKVGAKAAWKSTTTERAGRASLLKVFKQKDMRCGEVEHVFTAGGGRRYVLPYCKTASGQWKLAF
jgi:surface antigen